MNRAIWTRYRVGVAVVLLAWGSLALFVVWLLVVLPGGKGPIWPAVPLLLIAAVTGRMIHPRLGPPKGPPHCPSCGKSIFHRVGVASIDWGPAPMWPEPQCSECGTDHSSRCD